MDDALKALADAPLADPLKLNLPHGRKPARRSAKPVYTDEIGVALTKPELKARRETQANAKHKQMLDYYATTKVPFERVAQHCGITVDQARQAMRQRGRVD